MYFFKATLILACTLVHIAIHQIRHSLSELQFFSPIWLFPFFYQNAKYLQKMAINCFLFIGFVTVLQVFFPNLAISLFLSNRQIFTKNAKKMFFIHQIRHCHHHHVLGELHFSFHAYDVSWNFQKMPHSPMASIILILSIKTKIKKEVLITVRKFAHIKLMDQIVWNFSIKILFLRYLIKNGKGAFNSYNVIIKLFLSSNTHY